MLSIDLPTSQSCAATTLHAVPQTKLAWISDVVLAEIHLAASDATTRVLRCAAMIQVPVITLSSVALIGVAARPAPPVPAVASVQHRAMMHRGFRGRRVALLEQLWSPPLG